MAGARADSDTRVILDAGLSHLSFADNLVSGNSVNGGFTRGAG